MQEKAQHYGTIFVKTHIVYERLVRQLSADDAVNIIFELPDVKVFGEQMREAGVRWGVMYHGTREYGDTIWYVYQVYESYPTHIATFHWYEVSSTTGDVVSGLTGEAVPKF